MKLPEPVLKLGKNTPDWSISNVEKSCKSSAIKRNPTSTVRKPSSKAELEKHLHNLKTILLNTNATPIRSNVGLEYTCSFCALLFPNLDDLKRHTLENHSDFEKSNFMKNSSFNQYVVKLDITNLRCIRCLKEFESLDLLVEHLTTDHGKKMFTDINNHIVPIKFKDEAFICVICHRSFETFKLIQMHMNEHYKNYLCKVCNSSFICKRYYQTHYKRHQSSSQFQCNICASVFDSEAKMRAHSHIRGHKRNKCPHCHEMYYSYAAKMKHMETKHGAKPRVFKCLACDKSFSDKPSLSIHTRKDHLMERLHECKLCDKSFFLRNYLSRHMLTHTGEKNYQCNICLKAYARKNTLREHMRSHVDDRRFKCDICDRSFVQKCSWKSHMKSQHGEVVQ